MNPIKITINDFKGEMNRLLSLYPDDVAVYRPDQFPRNILEPKGNPRLYFHGLFAVLQRYSNIRPETWTELPGFRMRMERSRKPGDPPPSLVDFEKALRQAAKTENRPNLVTAARAVATLIEVLGESARIRTVLNHE